MSKTYNVSTRGDAPAVAGEAGRGVAIAAADLRNALSNKWYWSTPRHRRRRRGHVHGGGAAAGRETGRRPAGPARPCYAST